MSKLRLFVILDKFISYEINGKLKKVKHTSKLFKIINSDNTISYWFGYADKKERRDLDEKIDFEKLIENTPNIGIDVTIGSKQYQGLFYIFNEDFRTIDDEMIEVAEKIFKDINIDFGETKIFLCKHKGKKIFSCLESY